MKAEKVQEHREKIAYNRGKEQAEQDEIREIDKLLARSGWEMLPVKSWHGDLSSVAERYYKEGIQDMEKVWHEILKELKQKIKEES